MFKYSCGTIHLEQEYEMSNALSQRQYVDQNTQQWEVEYYKIMTSLTYSIPKIGMVDNKPVFYGGLFPIGAQYLNEDGVIVMTSKLRYKIVLQKQIRKPTDAEYKRYFQQILRSGIVSVQTFDSKAPTSRYPQLGKDEEYVYIVIKGKRYRWFDGRVRPWEEGYKDKFRNCFGWVASLTQRA